MNLIRLVTYWTAQIDCQYRILNVITAFVRQSTYGHNSSEKNRIKHKVAEVH